MTPESVDNWFSNSRRRIGWASFVHTHCDRDRRRAVEIATRFFFKPTAHSTGNRLEADLARMEENAKSLYGPDVDFSKNDALRKKRPHPDSTPETHQDWSNGKRQKRDESDPDNITTTSPSARPSSETQVSSDSQACGINQDVACPDLREVTCTTSKKRTR